MSPSQARATAGNAQGKEKQQLHTNTREVFELLTPLPLLTSPMSTYTTQGKSVPKMICKVIARVCVGAAARSMWHCDTSGKTTTAMPACQHTGSNPSCSNGNNSAPWQRPGKSSGGQPTFWGPCNPRGKRNSCFLALLLPGPQILRPSEKWTSSSLFVFL